MSKYIDKIFKYIDILTGISTGLMVLFVFTNVFLRAVFNSGLTWSEEVARYLFVFVTYIGAISAMRSNAHIGIDTLITKVNDRMKLFIYVLTQILIVIIMALVFHGTVGMMQANVNQTTASLAIPFPVLYSVSLIMAGSMILLSIVNILNAIKNKENISKIVRMSSEDDELVEEASKMAKAQLEELEEEI